MCGVCVVCVVVCVVGCVVCGGLREPDPAPQCAPCTAAIWESLLMWCAGVCVLVCAGVVLAVGVAVDGAILVGWWCLENLGFRDVVGR